jgi:hypothetical protein
LFKHDGFNQPITVPNELSALLYNGGKSVSVLSPKPASTGEQFTERLLTVVRTYQLYDINAFEFLTK